MAVEGTVQFGNEQVPASPHLPSDSDVTRFVEWHQRSHSQADRNSGRPQQRPREEVRQIPIHIRRATLPIVALGPRRRSCALFPENQVQIA